MNLLSCVRRWLARVLLRGRLLDWWVLRRGRQWDASYRVELTKTLDATIVPVRLPAFAPPHKLRQILLIADCQWEQDSLMPELERIAESWLLDLRPALKSAPAGDQARAAVAEAVRQFTQGNRSLSPDVILLYLRPALLSEEIFDVLRRRWNCPLFGMNLDDRQEFFRYGIFSSGNDDYGRWVKKLDLNITNCLPATEWYHQRGAASIYSPQGVHLTSDLTMPTAADFKYKISFLGSNKVERSAIIEEVRRAGILVSVFGSGWPNSRWIDNPNTLYRSTQINLGIGFATPSLTLTTVKGRDFECPGVGACYLTSYNWELPLHWELGREILCYRSVEELIEMFSWYGKRPELCLKIAQSAWRRSMAEHTWEHRFRKIFDQTGFQCQPAAAAVQTI
jgi:Glycosyl transferases group 1